MTSLKQIEANRRNALRGTGPRSHEGKAVVSKNALKHGIFFNALITSGDGKENENEFSKMLSDFNEYMRPQGIMEEVLAEKILINIWRLRRLLRYETGQAMVRLNNFEHETVNENPHLFDKPEKLEDKIDIASRVRVIPGDDNLDKIMRYETHLERSTLRILSTLKNLQEARSDTTDRNDEDIPVHQL